MLLACKSNRPSVDDAGHENLHILGADEHLHPRFLHCSLARRQSAARFRSDQWQVDDSRVSSGPDQISANGRTPPPRSTCSAALLGLPSTSARTKPGNNESGARLPFVARTSTRIAGASGFG